jgi:hypothetical protein
MTESGVYIIDSATPFLKGMAETKPEWMRRAQKSLGYMMQQEIKKGIRSGSPGGKKYKPPMPPEKRQMLERMLGGDGKKNYPILGRLVNAVGYQYKPAEISITVGWLSASAVNIGTKQEKGFERSLTDNMRYAFWAAGVPISRNHDILRIPARPTFDPMAAYLEPKITPHLEEKITSYADGFNPPPTTNRKRKYRVYGR